MTAVVTPHPAPDPHDGAHEQRAATPDLLRRFWGHVRQQPRRAALRSHDGNGWQPLTWAGYGTAVGETAAGLAEVGVVAGDRVAIAASNQAAWHEADLGILSAAATSVPIYPTNAAGQVAHVLSHAGVRVCFVGDRDQLAKVLLERHRLPDLERVVVFDEVPPGLDDDFVLAFDDLRALGRDRLAAEPGIVEARIAMLRGSSTATIVYTSGTTGVPKGALISFANLDAAIDSITSVIPIGPDDRFLSFLPLSHIAERIVSHFGQIVSGGETWFARSLSTVADDLPACRPTVFFGVPRVWEKFQTAIRDAAAAASTPQRQLLVAYFDSAAARVDAERAHHRWPLGQHLVYKALDRVVGQVLRARVGLDQARILVSGAAPVDPDLLWWFHGIGLPIAEVYGQTEDCGPTTLNPPGQVRIGSVGLPVPGLAVRLAPDGEILAKGPAVSSGYHHDPEATRDLLDEGGWMHSGDLGRLDADGYLYVIGRKKDLIITSSGKNIAPQEIEVHLQAKPLISQAVVVGDGRPYLTALLGLDGDAVGRWAHDLGKVADLESLLLDPDLRDQIGTWIDELNERRAPIEQIKTWRIIPTALTIAGGELTPTLKVRRGVVAEHHADLIAEMYA